MMFGHIFRTAAIATIFAGLTCAANAQTRVACVGNSITEGYGIWDQKKYPEHLQEMLGNDYNVQNFGVSSMTFANKGPDDRMSYWNTDKFKAALEFNPEIVVIELGTNDSKFFTDKCIDN
jgi:lysophospholipase L1-like esterase